MRRGVMLSRYAFRLFVRVIPVRSEKCAIHSETLDGVRLFS